MRVMEIISSTGTVAAIAATAFFGPYQAPTTSGVGFQNDNISRVRLVQESSSSKYVARNIQTHHLNWRKASLELFSNSRGFNSDEATMHANALKAASTVKGTRFAL